MKITVEIPDLTNTPTPKTQDAPTKVAPAEKQQKDAPTPKAASASPIDKSKDAPSPKSAPPPKVPVPPRPAGKTMASPGAKQPPAASEEQASQPAVSSGNFDHQGGIMDIADPDKGNPNVFQFVQPKGDA